MNCNEQTSSRVHWSYPVHYICQKLHLNCSLYSFNLNAQLISPYDLSKWDSSPLIQSIFVLIWYWWANLCCYRWGVQLFLLWAHLWETLLRGRTTLLPLTTTWPWCWLSSSMMAAQWSARLHMLFLLFEKMSKMHLLMEVKTSNGSLGCVRKKDDGAFKPVVNLLWCVKKCRLANLTAEITKKKKSSINY